MSKKTPYRLDQTAGRYSLKYVKVGTPRHIMQPDGALVNIWKDILDKIIQQDGVILKMSK